MTSDTIYHDQNEEAEIKAASKVVKISTRKISVILPVLAPTPFLRAMTEFCIKAMREHADAPFDLIVVEAEHDYFSDMKWPPEQVNPPPGYEDPLAPDKYLRFNPKIGGVREINAGIRAATTEFVVVGGNDVIVPPHWDTELLRCFQERHDCGIAALSASEPGTHIGPASNMPLLVEGMYSPFSMWRKDTTLGGSHHKWEYDESFLRVYQDSDLVMRMYEAGLRAYRTCRARCHHLLRMTNDAVETEAHNKLLKRDEELFYQRWGKSPLAMFAMIRSGRYVFGNEYESFLRPVGTPDHPANKVARFW